MASGDTLCVFKPQDAMPPSTNYATLDVRNGYVVLDFDDTTDESTIFQGFMPTTYSSGGFSVKTKWMATSATTGTISWDIAFMSVSDDADDLDTKSFAAANNINPTTASATGEVDYAATTFTDGADSDSVAAGEVFYLKVTRDANGTTSTDNMTGDMELVEIEITEV